eukprot:6596216-Pyramimonas_sp.AAC.1
MWRCLCGAWRRRRPADQGGRSERQVSDKSGERPETTSSRGERTSLLAPREISASRSRWPCTRAETNRKRGGQPRRSAGP